MLRGCAAVKQYKLSNVLGTAIEEIDLRKQFAGAEFAG
jgi:hypothetical protein